MPPFCLFIDTHNLRHIKKHLILKADKVFQLFTLSV